MAISSLARPTAPSLIATGTVGLACFATVAVAGESSFGAAGAADLILPTLGLVLALSMVLAYRFPLPLVNKATMQVTGIPVFLAVALLPPALAALTVGVGILGGELIGCRRCANPLSHVATHAGRLAVVALLASLIAHLHVAPLPPPLASVTLAAAAALVWLGDFVSVLLILVPVTRRPPHRLFVRLVRHAGAQEAVQYVMGLLAALAAMQQLWILPLLFLPAALVYVALKSASEKQEDTRQFLEGMADTVDLRDPYTGGHSRRVAELATGILGEMSKHGSEASLTIAMARIHDIGKIAVADHILNKPGRLTPEERAEMETHSDRGADLLARYRDFASGVPIVRHHHERWDGAGYPHGLAAEHIPFGARVIAVADSFDAMTTNRPYRAGMSVERASTILLEGRGSQWQAEVVDALMRHISAQGNLLTVPTLTVPDPDISVARESA